MQFIIAPGTGADQPIENLREQLKLQVGLPLTHTIPKPRRCKIWRGGYTGKHKLRFIVVHITLGKENPIVDVWIGGGVFRYRSFFKSLFKPRISTKKHFGVISGFSSCASFCPTPIRCRIPHESVFSLPGARVS